MDEKQLKILLDHLKEKYSILQKEVLEYFYEVEDLLFYYGEETGNYDLVDNFDKNIIDGLDLYGEDYCNEVRDVSNNLYYFRSFNDIEEVDYDFINELIDKSINTLDKKEDIALC